MNNIKYSDFENICRTCMFKCDLKFPQDDEILDVFYKLTNVHVSPKTIKYNIYSKYIRLFFSLKHTTNYHNKYV